MISKETEDKVTPITERENTRPNCTPWRVESKTGQMLRACPDKNVRKEMNER